jgi:hypothetical protein
MVTKLEQSGLLTVIPVIPLGGNVPAGGLIGCGVQLLLGRTLFLLPIFIFCARALHKRTACAKE